MPFSQAAVRTIAAYAVARMGANHAVTELSVHRAVARKLSYRGLFGWSLWAAWESFSGPFSGPSDRGASGDIAVSSIGGVATETIAEDFFDGLRYWRALARRKAPSTALV